MAKYCADCAYRAPGIKSNGKFNCTNRRSGYSEVPATQSASYCNCFCDALGSTYSTREKEEAYRASKRHGWFITTAICDILGYGMDNYYMEAYGYIREVFVEKTGYEDEFFNEYDNHGDEVANKLYEDENRYEYAKYLKENYLDKFVELVIDDECIKAINLYKEMYESIKDKYNINKSSVEIKMSV